MPEELLMLLLLGGGLMHECGLWLLLKGGKRLPKILLRERLLLLLERLPERLLGERLLPERLVL